MTKYSLVQSRIETFTRSDGKRIMLLPEPYCPLCASLIDPYENYYLCFDCYSGKSQVDKINLSRIHAATIYVPEVTPNVLINDEIINCKNDPTYVNGLAEVLEYVIKNKYPYLGSMDILIPTPRGENTEYNHVFEIAKVLSPRIGIPTEDILYKTEDYSSQVGRGREARIENVRGKIGCKERVNRKRIVLVDDVVTTGATMLNSAIALKEKGAQEVVGLVIGRDTSEKHLSFCGVLEEREDTDDES
jgi:hypothetical protein